MRLSVVMPALNEAAGIADALAALAPLRAAGHEVIVADGGSTDGTPALAAAGADRVIAAPRGRARQMNAGAAAARGEVLLFLHADTRLPPGGDRRVRQALDSGAQWGRFDVRIVGDGGGDSAMFPVIAALMNLRSRLSGIATGDQAIFMRRPLFEQLGGYAEQPLMEDVELCRRLKALPAAGAPACLRERVATSGRRWLSHGVWRTIVLMWRLRWRYWRGASPEQLARLYR
jgi:rSAM/selenodomain-associated transferase 2